MILKPVENLKVGEPPRLTIATQDDALVWHIPEGTDWGIFQLDPGASGAWTTSAVLTASASLNDSIFYAFSAGAVTYTGFGLKALLVLKGVRRVKLYVSTPQAGTDVVIPTLNVGKDNG